MDVVGVIAGFAVVSVESSQLESEHDAEDADDEQCVCCQVDQRESPGHGLPEDAERAEYGQDTESEVPSPMGDAVTVEVHAVADGREPAEHEPEGQYKG